MAVQALEDHLLRLTRVERPFTLDDLMNLLVDRA
jgi:hypothetical protein